MTVAELIAELQKMPQSVDAVVWCDMPAGVYSEAGACYALVSEVEAIPVAGEGGRDLRVAVRII